MVRGVECEVGSSELYDEVLRLTQEQAEATRSRDLERLLMLLSRRGELMATLQVTPDRAGKQAQRQWIVEMDHAQEASLLAWRAEIIAELERLRCGQTGLLGYRVHALIGTNFINQTS